MQVVNDAFGSKIDKGKPVEAANEEYLQQHKSSLPHLSAAVRVRHAMKPGNDGMKTKSVQDLSEAVQGTQTTLPDATEAMRLLQEMQVGPDAIDQYAKAARARWTTATMFQQR